MIGEGGSGGALAIGVADRVNMLENSIYSVISPEGCASILWKTAEKASDASEALKLNATNLYQLQLIDEIVSEGVGAHEAPEPVMAALKNLLTVQLAELHALPIDELLEQRYQRLMQFNSKVSL